MELEQQPHGIMKRAFGHLLLAACMWSPLPADCVGAGKLLQRGLQLRCRHSAAAAAEVPLLCQCC